jgi:translation initiation factor IF-2
MTVPLRTFGLLGLAVAMLGAGYLFVPSPGATTLPAPAATAPKPVVAAIAAPTLTPSPAPTPAAAPAPAAKPATTLAANRPPVPYVTRGHSNYYASPSIDPATSPRAATSSDGKTIDMGTFTANSLSSDAKLATDGTQQASLAEPPKSSGDDSKARAAVEQDGYRNVRNLVKDGDVWRGRAMRGRTEIAIRVNADGSVSAD